MKSKSKLKTILDAFKNDLPIDETWFQDRVEACNVCEFNSKNTSTKDLSIEDKVKITTGVCDNKEHCTLCGCCVFRKASQKVETCALKDHVAKAMRRKGLDPSKDKIEENNLGVKWKSIGVETRSTQDLNISSTSSSVDTVYLDAKGIVYNIQLKEKNSDLIEFSLVLHKKDGLKISSVKPGCSCTVPTQDTIDDNTIVLNIKLSTKGFSKNTRFTRNITVNYYITERKTKKAIITLIGKKR